MTSTTAVAPEPSLNRVWRSLFVVLSGTAAAQAVGFVFSVAVARIYPAESVSYFLTLIATATILSSIATLRYDAAICCTRSESETANVVAASVLLIAGYSLCLFLLLSIPLGTRLLAILNPAIRSGDILSLTALIAAFATVQTFATLAMRTRSLKRLSASRVTSAFTTGVAQVTGFLVSSASGALIAADLIGRSFGIGCLFQLLNRRLISVSEIKLVIARYRHFPMYSTWGALLNALCIGYPIVFMAKHFDLLTAGAFALTSKLLAGPVGLISTSLSSAFTAESIESFHNAPAKWWPIARQTFRRQILLAAGASLGISLFTPLVLPLLLGEKWAATGHLAPLLVPLLFGQLVSAPFGTLLDLAERQDLHLLREIVRAALVFGSLILSERYTADPYAVVFSFSIAGALAYVFGLFTICRALRGIR